MVNFYTSMYGSILDHWWVCKDGRVFWIGGGVVELKLARLVLAPIAPERCVSYFTAVHERRCVRVCVGFIDLGIATSASSGAVVGAMQATVHSFFD